jgi:CheY-like chemotaxis protein
MPTGGKLTIESAVVDLDESYVQTHAPVTPGRYAMLAMTDTGIGMDEQTKARIFEPFFTTKELGKGTGLGLATVYGIVKQSGGFIWVYSEPGQGATFKIYFPLADEALIAGTSRPLVQEATDGNETILLVEDAPAVRAAVRQALVRHGYRVLEAPSGRVALDIAANQAEPVHLLLTDVVMPEMSGRELVDRFAAMRPHVKVLYMSGYTDDAVLRHGVLRPGVAYLQKPFPPHVLTRKVRQILDSDTDS